MRPECAFEIPKYAGLGATVFLTAIFSFLSASYALHLAFRSAVLSILLGFLWSLIVFNLDRYLLLTLKREITPANLSRSQRFNQKGRELIVALPRFVLTIFISLIVSAPLELKLFEREIDAQIERMKSSVMAQMNRSVIEEFGIARFKSENERLRQEIDSKTKQTDALKELMLKESRGSLSGNDYNARRTAFLESQNELQELRKNNQQKLQENAVTIEHLEAEAYSRLKDRYNRYGESIGLLARLQAMNELKSQNSTISLASLFVGTLFILLLTCPLLVKLISPAGPYEHFWMAIENMANEDTRVKNHEHTSEQSPATDEDDATGQGSQTKKYSTLSPRRLIVFLCHSSSDKPIIRELYSRLKRDGLDPWLDEENILPGQDWSHEIITAVRSCDVVLVCLSRTSISKTGFLQREIRFALEVATEQPPGTIFLIPAKLEECEVPGTLRQLQWVNLFEETGYQKLILSLRSRALALGPIIEFGS